MSANTYEASQVAIDTNATQIANTDLKSLLFSFQGRITRRVFWGFSLATTFAFYAIIFTLAFIGGEQSAVAGIGGLVLCIPLVWMSLALQVKRWHDRDKSAWWVLISFIPIVGPLWTFVEAGCLRGTVGPNCYGADAT